jgi:adenosylhomocysteine nucleosidase
MPLTPPDLSGAGPVAVIAAMPGELAPWVRGWRRASRNGVALWVNPGPGPAWTAACSGAGSAAVERSFDELLKEGTPSALVSLGWAGSLGSSCVPGAAYRVREVIAEAGQERFQAVSGVGGRVLVSAAAVADAQAKRRLALAHGAELVDMEAAAVAAIALRRGIPFYCIKGVSDGADASLPDLNRFLDPEGRFRMAAFVLHSLARPWLWPGLARMGAHSSASAKAMAHEIQALGAELGPCGSL